VSKTDVTAGINAPANVAVVFWFFAIIVGPGGVITGIMAGAQSQPAGDLAPAVSNWSLGAAIIIGSLFSSVVFVALAVLFGWLAAFYQLHLPVPAAQPTPSPLARATVTTGSRAEPAKLWIDDDGL
jgi:hypothetical protein